MTDDVLVRVEGHAGRIMLNRPRALNALTLDMVRAIDATLLAWADDPAVALVVVDGAGGRAFCAGGDIRAMYEAARSGDVAAGAAFFGAEYAMNARVARFAKPYVAIMDGIVMGGGVGIAAHGSVRVVSESTMLAMPETGIGLFTDVGATWLLGRRGALGMHLALTGSRIGGADAILAGLADHFVRAASLPHLVQALCACADQDAVSACVRHFSQQPPQAPLAAALPWIEACYGGASVEAILAALQAHPAPAAAAAAAEIGGKSPSSLKVTLRALREAAMMTDLEQALAQELTLAVACLRSHDFVEGVRAVLVDKDRMPRWSPATLDAVTPALVDWYFQPSPHGDHA